jgi:acyl carrier protein
MALSRELLLDYFEEQMGLDTSDIEDDTLLFSSSILDSFSLVDLMMFIEQETGIKIEPAEVTLDNLDSVERILRFVDSHSS